VRFADSEHLEDGSEPRYRPAACHNRSVCEAIQSRAASGRNRQTERSSPPGRRAAGRAAGREAGPHRSCRAAGCAGPPSPTSTRRRERWGCRPCWFAGVTGARPRQHRRGRPPARFTPQRRDGGERGVDRPACPAGGSPGVQGGVPAPGGSSREAAAPGGPGAAPRRVGPAQPGAAASSGPRSTCSFGSRAVWKLLRRIPGPQYASPPTTRGPGLWGTPARSSAAHRAKLAAARPGLPQDPKAGSRSASRRRRWLLSARPTVRRPPRRFTRRRSAGPPGSTGPPGVPRRWRRGSRRSSAT
jgi:hypothetical protein